MIFIVISYLLRAYELIDSYVRVIMSWISVDHYHPVVQWIYRITEPVLETCPSSGPDGTDWTGHFTGYSDAAY